MKLLFPIYEFRPVKEYVDCLRFADGKWIPDDGEYDLAFVGKDNGFPMGIYFKLPYHSNIIWSWCKKGNWGANVTQHPRGNAWHYMLRPRKKTWGNSWARDLHPNIIVGNKAMDKCCSMYSCANGTGGEFHINDPYIKNGLVRNKETKEIIIFPEIFHCIYCGDIDWQKSETMTEEEEEIENINLQIEQLKKRKEVLTTTKK